MQLGQWKIKEEIDCPDKNDEEACIPFITMPIADIKIHDNYSEDDYGLTQNNDIALVKLAWSISYSFIIRPVCLPINKIFPPLTSIDVSGFGISLFLHYYKLIDVL